MILIGLVGKKRSGKDTAYEHIAKIMHMQHVSISRLGFADTLKVEIAKAIFHSDMGKATWTSISEVLAFMEEHKQAFRKLLQSWGTDFRRQLVSESYWIDKMLHKLSSAQEQVVVIPDCRFCNEAKMIKDVDGFLIKIKRPSVDDGDNHPSEKEMDSIDCDYIITNEGTISEFQNNVLQVFRQICIRTKSKIKA